MAPASTASGSLEVYGAPPLRVVPSEQPRLQPTSVGHDPLEQVITEDMDRGGEGGEGGECGDGGGEGSEGGSVFAMRRFIESSTSLLSWKGRSSSSNRDAGLSM